MLYIDKVFLKKHIFNANFRVHILLLRSHQWTMQYVGILCGVTVPVYGLSVCHRFGLWPLRFVAFLVSSLFGFWPFLFVAVRVCGRFGYGRIRVWPLWPVTFPSKDQQISIRYFKMFGELNYGDFVHYFKYQNVGNSTPLNAPRYCAWLWVNLYPRPLTKYIAQRWPTI